MERVTELKSMIHSKRANLYYLEKYRGNGKRWESSIFIWEIKHLDYWNIPIANTTVIILGTGTSITNSAGVLIRKIEIGEDKALARLKGIR